PSRVEVAGRHERRMGFCRTAVADYGELVLGTRIARHVRAALPNRRADSRGSLPKDGASAYVSECQRADAAARIWRRRSGAAPRVFGGAIWGRNGICAPPRTAIRACAAAARDRDYCSVHAPLLKPSRVRCGLLFIQVGGGARR